MLHLFTPYTALAKYEKNKKHSAKLPVLFNHNKSIKTKEVLNWALHPNFWVCFWFFFLLQWHSLQLLLVWSPYLTSHSDLQHQVPLLSVAHPPTHDSCTPSLAAANRLHPVSQGQTAAGRQVCSHNLNKCMCGTCRPRSKEILQCMCFFGTSHLISSVFCWWHRQAAKQHWQCLLLGKSLIVYLLEELELPGEGCR